MLTFTSIFSFVPGPFIVAHIMDKTCLVWGKTCTTKGNCWAYDTDNMRFYVNVIAGFIIAIGTLLDCGVWYYSKNLNVWEEANPTEGNNVQNTKS